jgi:hypothetical protein
MTDERQRKIEALVDIAVKATQASHAAWEALAQELEPGHAESVALKAEAKALAARTVEIEVRLHNLFKAKRLVLYRNHKRRMVFPARALYKREND